MIKLMKFWNTKDITKIIICIAFVVGGVWLDLNMPD